MPPLETHDRKQDAVLWNFVRQDRHGKPVLAAPVAVKVRWTLNDSQVVDATGNTIQSSGSVVMDRSVDNMSVMWLGELKNLPAPPTELHQVIKANTTPDIKNRFTRYEYTLMRYSDELPTVE